MRENEFERKVQQQLEELRIRPSDETWAKLEEELREKKKRRVAILFFLLAGLLLLGYSGYTFLYKKSNQPVAQNEVAEQHSSTEKTKTPDNNNNTAVAEKPVTTPPINQSNENGAVKPALRNVPGKEGSAAAEPNSPKKAGQLSMTVPGKKEMKGITKAKAVKNPPFELITSSAAKKKADTKHKNSIKGENENMPAIASGNEKAIAGNPVDQSKNQPEPVAKKGNNIASNNINSDTKEKVLPADSIDATNNAIAKTGIEKTEVPVIETPKPEIAKKKNNSKLKFGIEVSGGFVSSRDLAFGLNLFSGQKSFRSPSNYYGGAINNPATGAAGPVIIPPSDIESGNGWKLGLTAEKAISKRSSITAGIRYAHYDESLEVGSIKDTVVRTNSYSFAQNYLLDRGVREAYNNLAQQSSRTKYTNRYNFLELPVAFQTRVNNGKKMSILWNAGIAPGLLLGTNAIIYDSAAGGIYYKNDRAFKRFHFNVETGFAFQFGNNKKIQWSVGPAISLDMTRLMKEDVFTDKRYFLYTGLTGKLFLSRHKK